MQQTDMKHIMSMNFFDFCFEMQRGIDEGYRLCDDVQLCPQQMGHIFSATLVKIEDQGGSIDNGTEVVPKRAGRQKTSTVSVQ